MEEARLPATGKAPGVEQGQVPREQQGRERLDHLQGVRVALARECPEADGARDVLLQELQRDELGARALVRERVPSEHDRRRHEGRAGREQVEEASRLASRHQRRDHHRPDEDDSRRSLRENRGSGAEEEEPACVRAVAPEPPCEARERHGDRGREEHVDARLHRRSPEPDRREQRADGEPCATTVEEREPDRIRADDHAPCRDCRRQSKRRIRFAEEAREPRRRPVVERRLRRQATFAARDDPVAAGDQALHDEPLAGLAAREDRRDERERRQEHR